LLGADGFGNTVCTTAGLVCFGFKPQMFLGQAGLRVMSFAGNGKEYQARLDVVLDAPLVARWELDGSGQKILADDGLIEKFASAISPFITQEAAGIDDRMRLEKTWFYPWEAVRELVVNWRIVN
jgi:ATP-dependent DNA helicase RecG